MTKPVTGLTQWGGLTTGTTVQLDNNFTAVQAAINDLNTYTNYIVDGGSANTITAALGANLTASLAAGLTITVKVAASNTGATTLNFNGGGALAVQTAAGVALSSGMLIANGIYEFVYNGAAWVLQNPSGSSGLVLLSAKSSNGNATIDFNATLNNSYDQYLLLGSNVTVTGNQAGLSLRLGNGNASAGAYLTSNYQWASRGQFIGATGVDFGSTGNSSTASIVVILPGAVAGMGNAANQPCGFAARIFAPNSNTRCELAFEGTYINFANNSGRISGGGMLDQQLAITSVQVLSSNGNMPSGNFALYGVVRA